VSHQATFCSEGDRPLLRTIPPRISSLRRNAVPVRSAQKNYGLRVTPSAPCRTKDITAGFQLSSPPETLFASFWGHAVANAAPQTPEGSRGMSLRGPEGPAAQVTCRRIFFAHEPLVAPAGPHRRSVPQAACYDYPADPSEERESPRGHAVADNPEAWQRLALQTEGIRSAPIKRSPWSRHGTPRRGGAP